MHDASGLILDGPLAGRTLDAIRDAITETDDVEDLTIIVAALEDELAWRPWPHQRAPAGDWSIWLLMGGRGCGKTDTGAFWMDEHVKGPACDPRLPGGHRMSIVGPTLGDVAESCVTGPSGLYAHNPRVKMTGGIGGTVVRWPNGAEAKLFGGHSRGDVERFRAGGNRCAAWIEEAAAIPQLDAVLDQVPFGHRLGRNPKVVMSTTPKPRPALRRLVALGRRLAEHGTLPRKRWDRVMLTTATTDDNPALDAEVRAGLYDLYAGTRLGRQELEGELLDDFEGALWHREDIDALRIEAAYLPTLTRRCVGIDPSTWGVDVGGRQVEEGEIIRGIETGMVVSGIAADKQVYTLADASKRCSPAEWAHRAIELYVQWKCAAIVPEVNMGGQMSVDLLRAAEKLMRIEHPDVELPYVIIDGVRAHDGKRVRAEPVAGLTEQRRHHHVGTFPLLEDQLCGWDPNEAWSPDRLDAYVHAATWLKPWGASGGGTSASASRNRRVAR